MSFFHLQKFSFVIAKQDEYFDLGRIIILTLIGYGLFRLIDIILGVTFLKKSCTLF